MYTMYSAVCSFCIVLFFSVCVEAAPVILKHVSEVSLIINDSCMDQSNSVAPNNALAASIAQSLNDSKQVKHLNSYLNEIVNLCQEIQKNHSDWLARYTAIFPPLRTLISLSPVLHCQLTMQQNTQFYIMTQLSIFANYFRSNERDDAYPSDFKEGLIKLKNTLYRAICQLKNFLLLTSVTTNDIDKYVTYDYTQPWLSVDNEIGAIRRAVVMAELNILSQFFESLTYDSNSVAMRDNFPTSSCV